MLGLFSSTSRIIPRAVPLLFNYWLLMSSWAHELMSSWAHELIMGYKQGGGSTSIMFLLPRIRPRAVPLLFNFWLLQAHQLMSSWAHELMSSWATKNWKAKELPEVLYEVVRTLYPWILPLACTPWWAHELMSSWAHELMSWFAHELMCSWADELMSSWAD